MYKFFCVLYFELSSAIRIITQKSVTTAHSPEGTDHRIQKDTLYIVQTPRLLFKCLMHLHAGMVKEFVAKSFLALKLETDNTI